MLTVVDAHSGLVELQVRIENIKYGTYGMIIFRGYTLLFDYWFGDSEHPNTY